VLQPKTHSFIVKVWLEDAAEDGHVVWRGQITHVPSGARHSFDRLAAIGLFISPHLESLGVPMRLSARLRSWAGRARRHLWRTER
jgi:hypothetical protein